MVIVTAIPPRPALDNSRCTCVWPEEYARQEAVAQSYQIEQDKVDALANPLTGLSALPGKVAHAVSSHMPGSLGGGGPNLPLDTPMPESEAPAFYTTATSSDGRNGYLHPKTAQRDMTPLTAKETYPMDSRAVEDPDAQKRVSAKSSHTKQGYSQSKVSITPARSAKRVLRFTSQMKLRNLLAYREDLVIILRTIIPTYQQHQTNNPIAKRDTNLCLHCLTVLAHSLYHVPVRFDSYLREGGTRAMLTLVDDAVASLSNKVRMESLSHREAEHILRGELAVVEWRMATKYARLHKKIGVADLFPMKVGQFAELYVSNDDPPMKPDGLFVRGGKAAARMVGLGGQGASPSRQMAQGTAEGAALTHSKQN